MSSLQSSLLNSESRYKTIWKMLQLAKIPVYILRALMFLIDIILLPIYTLIQKPHEKLRKSNEMRAERIPLSPNNNNEYMWSSKRLAVDSHILQCETVDEMFERAALQFNKKPCLGRRPVKSLVGDQYDFDDHFEYMSFTEVSNKIDAIVAGLHLRGVKSGDRVAIFMETRREWMLTALALSRMNCTAVTLFSNLGQAGVIHIFSETKVRYVFTSAPLIPQLREVVKHPNVNLDLIVCAPTTCGSYPKESKVGDAALVHFEDLMKTEIDDNVQLEYTHPTGNDLAVIMFTSGSTGVPKGVQICHKHVVQGVKAIYCAVTGHYTRQDHDVELGYLPLAHIFEFEVELIMLASGIPIAYSSIKTLFDGSESLAPGCRGDIIASKPTVMTMVPVVLEKLKKGILSEINSFSWYNRLFFYFALDYKTFWRRFGYETPLIDYLFFNVSRSMAGGNLRFSFCGASSLLLDTQEFIRNVLCIDLLQGYASTETAVNGCMMDKDDLSLGRVGAPMYGVSIRLKNWEEGGYRMDDKPNPRGEILISNLGLSNGYLNNEAETKAAFLDEYGRRWWVSGDIGEMHPNGTLQIIDRKKDLVKLMNGEYVSFGKIESKLKNFDLISNLCVYGNSKKNSLIALIVPNRQNLKKLAYKLDVPLPHSTRNLCRNQMLKDFILQSIQSYGLENGLAKIEIPVDVILCHEEWKPENGLVTASLKLRRPQIENHFRSEIEEIFCQI